MLTIACALCVAGSIPAAQVNAQDGYGFGLGLGFSQPYFQGYHGINQKRIPYFALYPPVYYGQKVARPYGFSPFATPPGVVPAEMNYLPPVDFKEVVNPFFTPAAPAAAPESAPIEVSHDKAT